MEMAAATRMWTVDEVRALPDDGNRYEVIDGELLVTPAPAWSHQRLVSDLHVLLATYAKLHALADVLVAPADVVYGHRTLVEPDIFAVPLVAGRRPRTWEEAGRLLLAVEVLSPSTARADRIRKRALYQREGVPEYWIVDDASRLIERWRPGDDRPEILVESIAWQPDAARPPLVIDLPDVFAAALPD